MSDPGRQELHPLVAGFEDAETYDRGRPQYGERVVSILTEELGLGDGAPVLELGAGTGQLSRALVAAGLDVTAIEPLEGMREVLARAIGAQRVRAGAAEQIPVADGSVDAVLAADSFHWFDEVRALAEIHRVLRPGGGVAILRATPVLDAPWSQELGALIIAARPQHPAFGERGAAAALEQDPAFGPVREAEVASEQLLDREGILAYLASMSWIGSLQKDRRSELLADARRLLERNGVSALRHQVRHHVWMARLT
jgi:SAM-dependent methyltransferase